MVLLDMSDYLSNYFKSSGMKKKKKKRKSHNLLVFLSNSCNYPEIHKLGERVISSLDGDYFVCANQLPKQRRNEFSSAMISPGEAYRYKHLEMRIGEKEKLNSILTHVSGFSFQPRAN